MKFTVDHDLHIHSNLSNCGKEEQTIDRIVEYALKYGIKTLCLTNHFWDETVPGASKWYFVQNYPHVASAKPLPQIDGIRFLFGCETELDKNLTLGIARENYGLFDFIVIPATHFHMADFVLFPEDVESIESRARAWIRRVESVLDMDLPFHKIGLAHLTTGTLARPREDYLKVIETVPEADAGRIFEKAAKQGVGIELNSKDMNFTDEEADTVLRLYRIAKDCGCKFYCGSDAHAIAQMECAKAVLERAVDLLGLTEDDKFILR